MKIDPRHEDLRPYRKFGVTLLQLMAGLAVLGVVGTIILKHIFS
jgi:Tfp pilus assembly protein PilE